MKKLLTLLAALACMGFLAAPASAVELTNQEKERLKTMLQEVDWNFYGSARIGTWWTNYSEKSKTNPDPGNSLSEMTGWDHSNARIGARVRHNSGWSARFEYGSKKDYKNANVRHLYGAAEVGPGKFLVGKTWTPFDEAVGISMQSGRAEKTCCMKKYLGYTKRRPQLKYSVEGFEIAFMYPDNTVNDANVQIPQVEAGYSMGTKIIKWNVSGAFVTYDMEYGEGKTLTAYSVAPRITLKAMKPLTMSLAGFYGQNVSQLNQPTEVIGAYNTTDEEDTTTYSATGAIRYPIEAVTFEAGCGYQESDNDEWENKDNAMKGYITARVPITRMRHMHIFVQPEVGYKDFMDDKNGDDQGDETYVGAEWRFNF